MKRASLRTGARTLGARAPANEDGLHSIEGYKMGEALFWGLVAGSSLVLGGLIGLYVQLPSRWIGVIMAFGAGVLISAVAYELVGEAVDTAAGGGGVALGLFAGALTFFAGDALIGRLGGDAGGDAAGGSALAIVLGTVLDGIPETAVLGLSLLTGEGVSVAVLAAVFLSNLPEAIAATIGLAAAGWTSGRALGLWALVAVVCAVAALAGYVLLDGASPRTIAIVLAFAGGAVLTMLADAMMPEAFERGGKLAGLATTLGFALAFAISALE
jgi:ZIP family zinc transporter